MTKIKIIVLLLLVSTLAYSQIEEYDYNRPLSGVNDQWHELRLPNDVFGKISPYFSDLRIIGIRPTNDTIEAPYIIEKKETKNNSKSIDFKIINKVSRRGGSYITLAMDSSQEINEIILDFKEHNFDWRLNVEGSQNQSKWFTVVEDYRILSIRNEATNYKFTKIKFPTASYQYFRIYFQNTTEVNLLKANVFKKEEIAGDYQEYPLQDFKITENKAQRQTEIIIDLDLKVPVSKLAFDINNDFDYYRHFTINYLLDSFKTQKGWRYNYRNLSSATLSSIEGNEFTIATVFSQKFKFIIQNNDNQAIKINNVSVRGPIYKMIARFTEDADYSLVYGHKTAKKPQYDISHFANNIPKDLKPLQIGKEQKTGKSVSQSKPPLFENKTWLWAIMVIIILLLGWFTLKMIKDEKAPLRGEN